MTRSDLLRPLAALLVAAALLPAPPAAARDGFGHAGGFGRPGPIGGFGRPGPVGGPGRIGGPGRPDDLHAGRGLPYRRDVRGRRPFFAEFGYDGWFGGLPPYDGLPYDAAGPFPFPGGPPGPDGFDAASAEPAPPPAQACVPPTAPGLPNVIYPSAGAPPVC